MSASKPSTIAQLPGAAARAAHGIAVFDAALLPLLRPFYTEWADSPTGMRQCGIFVEPCAAGGVVLVALDGVAMAAIRDLHGRASGPMTLFLPDAAFEACVAPPPLKMTFCGDQYTPPMPEWTMPGKIIATAAGLAVYPKMRPPCFAEAAASFGPALFDAVESGRQFRSGVDYRWKQGVAINWRRPIAACLEKGWMNEAEPVFCNPALVGRFAPALEFAQSRPGARGEPAVLMATGKEGAVIVTLPDWPDFVGLFMPMKACKLPPLPQWWAR